MNNNFLSFDSTLNNTMNDKHQTPFQGKINFHRYVNSFGGENLGENHSNIFEPRFEFTNMDITRVNNYTFNKRAKSQLNNYKINQDLE